MRILAATLLAALVAAPAAKVDVGEGTYGLASGGGSVWAGGLSSIVVLPFGGHAWVSHTTGNALWRL